MTDLCALGDADLIRAMRDGASIAREVMQAHLDRIEAAEPTLAAWARLD
jgi:Asp-tRNA(Asn)/Glu-tRNA(Gln) amidotransferase A subunit family amidase